LSGAVQLPIEVKHVIRKIIASGENDVERAALDIAVKLGIPCGGWTVRSRLKQNDPLLDDHYGIQPIVASGYQEAVERNVVDAQGTLIISCGKRSAESRYAVQMALKHQRQLLHVDLFQHSAFESASLINSWIFLQMIRTMHVAGSCADSDRTVYRQTRKILETAFYLGFVKSGFHSIGSARSERLPEIDDHGEQAYPETVEEAVERLKSVLPLKDRTLMANMQRDEIDHLRSGLGEYIKQNFGFYAGNRKLLQSCAQFGRLVKPLTDEACGVILRALWENLQKTHRLRLIK
jgi:hypothetical protein